MQIAMTIPVTSASCERSFSAMKLVKPCLRNRSGDQRLSDLVTLFTCKDRELDRKEIIESFANASTRRVQFICLMNQCLFQDFWSLHDHHNDCWMSFRYCFEFSYSLPYRWCCQLVIVCNTTSLKYSCLFDSVQRLSATRCKVSFNVDIGRWGQM